MNQNDYERYGGLLICPVCEGSINRMTDRKAQQDLETGNWFHGPCFRFHEFVFAVERVQ
jgi:hypothetical protein